MPRPRPHGRHRSVKSYRGWYDPFRTATGAASRGWISPPGATATTSWPVRLSATGGPEPAGMARGCGPGAGAAGRTSARNHPGARVLRRNTPSATHTEGRDEYRAGQERDRGED